MIRLGLGVCFIAALMILSLKRWYYGLCGLVVLTVLTQHNDLRTLASLISVQGANPWNLVLACVLFSWAVNRRRETPRPALPWWLGLPLCAYIALVVSMGIVGAMEASSIKTLAAKYNSTGVLLDAVVNPLKYVLVGVLFFSGANTPQRVRLALISAVGSGILYALLMFKSMKLRIFTMDYQDARRLTDKLLGLYANDLAEVFAFVLWGGLCLYFILGRRWQRTLLIGGLGAVFFSFLSLKSRAGFLSFAGAGLMLGVVRWRRLLFLLPVGVAVVLVCAPTVTQRLMTGVGEGETDWNEISAGRTTGIWPPVIEQISEAPLLGHGRFAILREDCYEEILAREFRVPAHPHNGYLEVLLDGGVVGLVVCLALVTGLGVAAYRVMRSRADVLMVTAGTIGLIALVTELLSGVAGPCFFPTQSAVPYLCVWGVVIRYYCDIRRNGLGEVDHSPQLEGSNARW